MLTERSERDFRTMTAQILDGKATAAVIRSELAERVSKLAAGGVQPGLGTVLVGDDPGSHAYVGGKHRDCAEVGVASIRRDLPDSATQADVEAVVAELNADPTCTGYIVQLLSLIHISEPTRRTPISYAVFCLK